MIVTKTDWLPAEKLIITQISGDVDMAEVEKWEQTLEEALAQIPDNGQFKIFVNLHGFKAANFEVHKRFRTIVPATLANYGWKAGYVDLFEEAADLKLTKTRGISCVAAVHVHQDETKIEKYETMFGKENEHFYTDPAQGETWIRQVSI